MSTEADLHMMQLSDSLFPTGLFAVSGGIETMFMQKKMGTAGELREFLKTAISQQLGPCDCVMLANAHRSTGRDEIIELDSVCHSMRTNKEVREASCRSGSQLARCVAGFLTSDMLEWYCSMLGSKKASGEYPVSFGVCCRVMGIKTERALAMFLYGYVASSVGATLRLGMIDHMEGQEVIHALKPLISETVSENYKKPASEAWQFAPQAEIYQMVHEGTDAKMFIT